MIESYMKRQQVEGYWTLKSRIESPKQDKSFIIGDRVYSIIPPTIEVLAINPKKNKCDLLGIDLVEEDESSENKYELSSFLPVIISHQMCQSYHSQMYRVYHSQMSQAYHPQMYHNKGM